MSYAQQGAQAGAAFGPWGAAVGGVAGFAMDYDKADSAQPGPGSPTGAGGDFMGGTSGVSAYGTGLDGSGWIVNFGGTQNASSASEKSYNKPQAQAIADAAAESPAAWAVPLGIAAVALFLIARKRKG